MIRKLIADPTERLGINGFTEIKLHPFFSGIKWKEIREKTPPFIPEVCIFLFYKKIFIYFLFSFLKMKIKSPDDVSNFDKFEEEGLGWGVIEDKKVKNINVDRNFFGYEFNRSSEELVNPV